MFFPNTLFLDQIRNKILQLLGSLGFSHEFFLHYRFVFSDRLQCLAAFLLFVLEELVFLFFACYDFPLFQKLFLQVDFFGFDKLPLILNLDQIPLPLFGKAFEVFNADIELVDRIRREESFQIIYSAKLVHCGDVFGVMKFEEGYLLFQKRNVVGSEGY